MGSLDGNQQDDAAADRARDPRPTVLAVLILPLSIGLALIALAATLAVAVRRLFGRLGAGRQ